MREQVMRLSMTEITDQLVVLKENGVGLVKLNNQGKRNAMTFEMWRDIPEILDDFEADSNVRVVVISGCGGRAFGVSVSLVFCWCF